MRAYGYSEAEIWDMPFTKANWEYLGWLESKGAVQFRSSEEEEILAEIEKEQNGQPV